MFQRMMPDDAEDSSEFKETVSFKVADLKQGLDDYVALKKKLGWVRIYSKTYEQLKTFYESLDPQAEEMSPETFRKLYKTVLTVPLGSKTEQGLKHVITKLNEVAGYDWYEGGRLLHHPQHRKADLYMSSVLKFYDSAQKPRVIDVYLLAFKAKLLPIASPQEVLDNLRLIFATTLDQALPVIQFLAFLKRQQVKIVYGEVARILSHINRQSLQQIMEMEEKKILPVCTLFDYTDFVMMKDVQYKSMHHAKLLAAAPVPAPTPAFFQPAPVQPPRPSGVPVDKPAVTVNEGPGKR